MYAKIIDICFILFIFNFLILGIGYFVATKTYLFYKIPKKSWLELISVGAGFLILLLASFGVIIANLPYSTRSVFAIGFICLLFTSNCFVFLKRKLWAHHLKAPKPQIIFYMGYIGLTVVAIIISNIPIQLPQDLVDGPYVAKVNTLPVRIQYLTGNLPADNVVPHVVSQYLLKDISFKDNHPILPGQEVSNRPILMALTTVPFMAALKMPMEFNGEYPKFYYVGIEWPDFRILIQDEDLYEISLVVGILLNGLILLGAAAFITAISNVSSIAALFCVLAVLTSPYFLFQTLFIWPKSLAGFFIALALLHLIKRKSLLLGAIFIGAAYLSHPYAMVFVAGATIWVLMTCYQCGWDSRAISVTSLLRRSINFKPALIFFFTLLLMFLPWVLWTRLILQLPASDLIEQNLFLSGQSKINFIWVRVLNFASTFLPVHILNYPFNLRQLISGSSVNVVGATGIIIYAFFIKWIFNLKISDVYPYITTLVVPSALLILIFSNQAVPAVHGLQLPILLITFLGSIEILRSVRLPIAVSVFSLQLLINIFLLERYMHRLFN